MVKSIEALRKLLRILSYYTSEGKLIFKKVGEGTEIAAATETSFVVDNAT